MTQMTAQQALEQAMRHHRDGRLQEAESIYRQVLAAQPLNGQALHLLGVIALQVGRAELARELIARAIAAVEKAPSRQVDVAELWNNLGLATRQLGQIAPARDAFAKAVSVNRHYAEAWNNLGGTMQELGQFEQAVQAFRESLSLRADYPEGLSNLGNALHEIGNLEEAFEAFRKSSQLQPNNAETIYNLAKAFRTAGRLDEAIACYQQAIQLNPDFVAAQFNLALTLLLQGDFERRWNAFEWRWKTREFQKHRVDFRQPRWDGGYIPGSRLLLHAEQGMGDSIQFLRYLPQVKQRGATVVVQCPQELLKIFQISFDGMAEFVAKGQPLTDFDLHSPLLSLPLAMQTRLDSIPSGSHYLRADPEAVEKWRVRLSPSIPRVGLVWAGRPQHWNDRHRSLAFDLLIPLLEVPGVTWYSLQKTGVKPAMESAESLIDWTDELQDFSDTAALIENLDLVISVDTAVAHLAGALGKPVWTLLPFAPDWRWMLNRNDSPWYSTMRLFRQPKMGDWPSVIEQVRAALEEVKA